MLELLEFGTLYFEISKGSSSFSPAGRYDNIPNTSNYHRRKTKPTDSSHSK